MDNRIANKIGVGRVYKKKPSTIAYEFPDPAAETPVKYKMAPAEPTAKIGSEEPELKKNESLGEMLKRMKTLKEES